MLLDKVVIIFISLIGIIFLSVRYVKRYAPENLVIVSMLAFAFGSYIPFAIYNVYIPIYIQVIIFALAIVIPNFSVILQYNNIILSRKIIYYKMKYYYHRKEYEKTIEIVTKLMSLEGRTAPYLHILGQCYKHTGDFINSRDSFALAVELDRNDYASYFELGLVLDETNKKETAMVMFNKATKIKPDFYEAQEALGICLTSQGKFESAISIYKKALKQHPQSYEMYYNIAMLESEIGNYESAILAFKKVGELKPDLYTAFYNLGKLYYMQKEFDEAIEAYCHILNSTTYGPKAYYQLAVCYSTKKEYEKAMTSLEYAMELDDFYIKKADTEYCFNNIRDRIETYKKAKETNRLKQMQKHNFMNKGFKIFFPKQEELTEGISIEEEIKNHA